MDTRTDPPQQLHGRPLVLVGRTREREILQDQLALARQGHGSLVLIGGDAGIGKTALADTFSDETASQDVLVLVGRCYDRTETPPNGPFLDLLRGYEPAGGLPPLPFSPWLGPAASGSQAALYEHVLTFFQEVAANRTLILLLEDLHWADQASLDLLRVIARALSAWAALVLVTYRADELSLRHPLATLLPLLEHDAPVVHLTLHPLKNEAIAALALARYPLPTVDAARLAAYLVTRSKGNPLFATQLLRALEEQGILQPDGPGWTLGDLGGLGVPLPLLRVIELRLLRLGDGTRALLDVAALIGQEIPLRLWANAAQVEEAAVEDAVEATSGIGVLEASADGMRARFVHALVRETLYEGIFPPRRRALHRRIAELLATVPAVDPDAPAYHFAQAGDSRAIGWLRRAAERAERVFALRTAAERLTAALALLREQGVERREQGWVLLQLSWLYRYGGFQQGITAVEEAERVALEVGDRVLAAQAAFQRGHLLCRQGRLRQGLAVLAAGVAALDALSPAEWEHGRALARPSDVRWTLPDAQAARGTFALFLAAAGRYAEAQAATDPLQREPERVTMPMTDVTVDQALGILHSALGHPTEARLAYARARDAYEAAGHHLLASSMSMQELRYVVLPYQTEALAERQALARRASDALRRAGGTITTSDLPAALPHLPLLALEGHWAEARKQATTPHVAGPWQGLCRGVLAALAHGQGDVDLAWERVLEALPTGPATEPGNDDFREALPLQRLAAALALEAGDLRAAHAWLAAAPLVARAAALLAALPAAQDDATTYPAGLSAREVDVLRHLAAGQTNRDIATALFLSEHTVRAHVRHIYAKTGADNRAGATAFALRHHLA